MFAGFISTHYYLCQRQSNSCSHNNDPVASSSNILLILLPAHTPLVMIFRVNNSLQLTVEGKDELHFHFLGFFIISNKNTEILVVF